MNYKNIKRETRLGMYIPIPTCLLNSKLSSTTLLIYGSLLNRAMLSQRNGWSDNEGNIFIRFTIEELSEYVGKGHSTVKTSLKELEDEGLIRRKRVDQYTSHIFLMAPEDCLESLNSDHRKPIFRTSKGQKTGFSSAIKPTTNNYIELQDKYTYREGESF